MARRPAVLDAPSNLGLPPPAPGVVPGCAKAPGAIRDNGLVARLGALDAGCVVVPRYDPGEWQPGDGVCQADAVAAYSARLADRVEALLAADRFPVLLGGDCSVLLGPALALRRRTAAGAGRYGLVFVDGHTDFRHPGNAEYVGAAAGEDLALVTGRGESRLTDMDNLRPYFQDRDVVVLGIRDRDEYKMDIMAAGMAHRTVPVLRAEGMPRTAAWARRLLADTDGFWVHLDVDVLDPTVMPAVDAPDEGGIGYGELENLLADLVVDVPDSPPCLGVEVTVFDPDYDPDGRLARELTDALVAGLRPFWTLPPPVGEPSGQVGDDEPVPRSGAFGAERRERPHMVTVRLSGQPPAGEPEPPEPADPSGTTEAAAEPETVEPDAPEPEATEAGTVEPVVAGPDHESATETGQDSAGEPAVPAFPARQESPLGWPAPDIRTRTGSGDSSPLGWPA